MIKLLRPSLFFALTLTLCGLALASCTNSTVGQQGQVASPSEVASEETVDTQVNTSQSEAEQLRIEGIKLNVEGTELTVAWEEN